jgi:glycosyltransferase involved in cell wall biosynthesis
MVAAVVRNMPLRQRDPLLPFRFPVRLRDRCLAWLAACEGLARGVYHRLRSPAVGVDRAAWESWLEGLRLPPAEREGEPASPVVAPGAPIVVLATLPWAFRPQRPQWLARAMAASGPPVLYVEAFRRQLAQPRHQAWRPGPEPLMVLKVRVPGRPDPYRTVLAADAARRVAERIAAGLTVAPRAVVAQLPFWADVASELVARFGCPLVYDRMDLHTAFPGVPPEVGGLEQRLLVGADLVVATSEDLLRRSRDAGARRLALVRNGYLGRQRRELAGAQRGHARRRVGYVGALGEWFDVAALAAAARAAPEVDFVLVGRLESHAVRQLGRLANVTLRGEIPQPRVPALLGSLDAVVIPFVDNELTRAVDPVKFYEALAAGLPVVARRLPELARFGEPAVYLYDDPSSFAATLRQALDEDAEAHREARRALVAEETWERRADQLLAEIAALETAPAGGSGWSAAAALPALAGPPSPR